MGSSCKLEPVKVRARSQTCSRRIITIFGGKLRTASPGEFVFSGLVAFVAFVILGSVQLSLTHPEEDGKLCLIRAR